MLSNGLININSSFLSSKSSNKTDYGTFSFQISYLFWKVHRCLVYYFRIIEKSKKTWLILKFVKGNQSSKTGFTQVSFKCQASLFLE